MYARASSCLHLSDSKYAGQKRATKALVRVRVRVRVRTRVRVKVRVS